MKRDAHFGLFIPKELHHKFQYVAAYEGRSMSNYMLFLMQKAVRDFETANGPIELPVEDET
jgi:hypothetical protein